MFKGCPDWHNQLPFVKALLGKKKENKRNEKKEKERECNLLIAQYKSLNSGMGFVLSFLMTHLFFSVTSVHHPSIPITNKTIICSESLESLRHCTK